MDGGDGWATVLGITESSTTKVTDTHAASSNPASHLLCTAFRLVPPTQPRHSFLSFQPISTLILSVAQM